MNPAAYLDADASALADREPRRARALSDPHLQEVEYAADMFQRGVSAFRAELARLRAVDVPIDWNAAEAACDTLLRAAIVLHIRALGERERRDAC